ncbi:hypothetical protein ACFLTJ_03285 [Chloroflexota bacterium]
MNSDTADLLLFAVVTTTNILTFFVFVSRVKWPNAGYKLAIATVLMAIPTTIIVVLNATAGREWLYLVMPLIFIAWAILTLIIDLIRNIEFRQPRKLKILVPFLLLFYIGLGGMGMFTWRISFTFWVITAITFALHFVGTAYAFRHGKG